MEKQFVTCSQCHASLSSPLAVAGKSLKCPRCGTLTPVPSRAAFTDTPVPARGDGDKVGDLVINDALADAFDLLDSVPSAPVIAPIPGAVRRMRSDGVGPVKSSNRSSSPREEKPAFGQPFVEERLDAQLKNRCIVCHEVFESDRLVDVCQSCSAKQRIQTEEKARLERESRQAAMPRPSSRIPQPTANSAIPSSQSAMRYPNLTSHLKILTVVINILFWLAVVNIVAWVGAAVIAGPVDRASQLGATQMIGGIFVIAIFLAGCIGILYLMRIMLLSAVEFCQVIVDVEANTRSLRR